MVLINDTLIHRPRDEELPTTGVSGVPSGIGQATTPSFLGTATQAPAPQPLRPQNDPFSAQNAPLPSAPPVSLRPQNDPFAPPQTSVWDRLSSLMPPSLVGGAMNIPTAQRSLADTLAPSPFESAFGVPSGTIRQGDSSTLGNLGGAFDTISAPFDYFAEVGADVTPALLRSPFSPTAAPVLGSDLAGRLFGTPTVPSARSVPRELLQDISSPRGAVEEFRGRPFEQQLLAGGVYDPLNLVPGLGIAGDVDDIVRLSRAAGRGVSQIGDAFSRGAPQLGRRFADETGSINLGAFGRGGGDPMKPPRSVQRIEEPGVTAGSTSKPQGLYTSPADAPSPHADLGGERIVLNTNPAANILEVDATDLVTTNRGTVGQSAGVAAARNLLGNEEVARLIKMRKPELVAELTRRYPNVEWGRYFDQQEMVEGLAGILARERGFDAIWAIDRATPDGSWNEYVGLTDKAFSEAAPQSGLRGVLGDETGGIDLSRFRRTPQGEPNVPGLEPPMGRQLPEPSPVRPAPKLEGQVQSPAVRKLEEAIQTAIPLRKEIEASIRASRAQKGQALGRAIEEAEPGDIGFLTSVLKGADTPDVPRLPGLSHEDFVSLWDDVKALPLSDYERLNTLKSLNKVATGGAPTAGEIRLLREAFGPTVADLAKKQRGWGQKSWETVLDLAGLPRALKSSMDLSWNLRQGLPFISRGAWWRAWAPQIKAFKSKRYAEDLFDQLAAGPKTRHLAELGNVQALEDIRKAERAQMAGLDLVPLPGMSSDVASREEMFRSEIAAKIPGVGGSNRAYVTAGNKVRRDVFDPIADAIERNPNLSDAQKLQEMQSIAEYIKTATGRATVPKVLQANKLWNLGASTMWAPRLLWSRVKFPFTVASASPTVRKNAARDLVTMVSGGLAGLMLGEQAGLWSVNKDPRSTDFLRGRIGNTRLDPWGGFQPIATFLARLWTGERQTSTGDITPFGRKEAMTRFLRSKLDPGFAIIVDTWTGETYLGDQFKPQDLASGSQLRDRFMPLSIDDIIDAIDEHGLFGIGVAPWSVGGGGANTYLSDAEADKQLAEELFPGVPYQQVRNDREMRRQLEADPRFRGFQSEPIPVETKVSVGFEQLDRRRAELEAEFAEDIKRGFESPEDRKNAVRAFRQGLFEAGRALLGGEDIDEFLAQARADNSLRDRLAAAYWGAEVPELEDGTLDFDARDRIRAHVLDEARLNGVDPNYITGEGKGTYRGDRFDDPSVWKEVKAYEDAVEKAKPLYEAEDKIAFLENNPDVLKSVRDFDLAPRTLDSFDATKEAEARQKALDDKYFVQNRGTWREQTTANLTQLRQEKGQIFADLPDSVPETKIDEYFSVIDNAVTATGEVDWAQVDAWMARQSPAVREEIENRERRYLSPKVLEWREAQAEISETGYWELPDKVLQIHLQQNPGLGQLYQEGEGYYDFTGRVNGEVIDRLLARGMTQAQADAVAQQVTNELFKDLADDVSKVRKAWRENYPGLLELLTEWDYYQPGKETTRQLLGLEE